MAANPEEFWPGFGNDGGLPEIECEGTGSLAKAVLNTYGIECEDSTGGELKDLDIKLMDAMQVIKLSLLETSADEGEIYEPVMSSDGKVEFVRIGTGDSLSDIYYEIQSGSYIESCGGVMVTGKKPMTYRRPISWRSVWEKVPREIYDTGIMFNGSCLENGFNQYCSIVYNDPHLDSNYNDGIDNLIEITNENPHDTIVGYAYYLDWDRETLDKYAQVLHSDSTKVLIELPLNQKGLGVLAKRPNIDPRLSSNINCYENAVAVTPDNGIKVPLPSTFRFESVRGTTVDKFAGLEGVFVIGKQIDLLRGVPPTKADSVLVNPAYGSSNIWVSINEVHDKIFTLSKGEHYEEAYDEEDPDSSPYVVFADNSLKTDPLGIPDDAISVPYFIDPTCAFAVNSQGEPQLRGEGLILPTSKLQGVLVTKVLVAVRLETPSINVYHPNGFGNRARKIAESLEFLVAPIIAVDEPPPIAFNGSLIDQVSSKIDHDPTTAQNFEDTPMEWVLDQMSGNGMALNLTFLDEDQVIKLSGALFNYLNSGDGIESTYICGPTANPQLGALAPNGGIINSINYSYQDSSAYTISVNAGQRVLGEFAQPGVGGPTFKATEEVSYKGTILQDNGSNVYFKVRVDGIGERIAVNMTPAVLRVGDKVMISIHNNPVEA